MNWRRRHPWAGRAPLMLARIAPPAVAAAILLAPLPFDWTTRIDKTVVINRPRAQVFDYVTTPANWLQRHPSSLAVRGVTDHPARVDEKVTEDFIFAGWRGTVVWTVAESDAPQHWVIESDMDGSRRGSITYTLSAIGDNAHGTRFRREFVYLAPNLLFVFANSLVLRARIDAESTQALAQFKSVLERLPCVVPPHMQIRTELFFSRSMPEGGTVTDAQWRRFLDKEVAPRFPQGFTVLKGDGQYRGTNGMVTREGGVVLVLIHPVGTDTDDRIEQIRAAYRQRFKQDSVLRIDNPVMLLEDQKSPENPI